MPFPRKTGLSVRYADTETPGDKQTETLLDRL